MEEAQRRDESKVNLNSFVSWNGTGGATRFLAGNFTMIFGECIDEVPVNGECEAM